MRLSVALLSVLLSANQSLAQNGVETITAPSSGGVFCLDQNDIIKLVSKEKPVGKCGAIPPGAKIFAVGVKTIGDIKGGAGIIEGVNDGKAVAFLVIVGTQKSADKPEKPPFEQRTFKIVSPSDVEATPSKWESRDIEFKNVNIYWVSDDDVRFVTAANLTVFAGNVKGEDVSFYRENCETSREAFSSKCTASIRFSYHQHGRDNPTSRSMRVVLKTDDILILKRKPRRQ